MYFKSKFLCEALNQYQKIVIYGTGNFAHEIYPQLIKYGLKEKIVCFTQTQRNEDETLIDGIPVISIAQLNYDKSECVVLIAVSELYKEEIERTLFEYKYSNIISLTDFQVDYNDFMKDYSYLTSFEEYCGYIADWYVKNHGESQENKIVMQELLDKGQYINREKNNDLIIMICGHLSARTIKIAGALKRKKYEIIMLSYFDGANPWYLDELEKINIQLYQCRNVIEMMYYALQYYPLIYFFEPCWGDCTWTEIMLKNKKHFGKVVLALYDVMNDGYTGLKEQQMQTEKYSLEHADGIVWRWFSKEYLEEKGFKYQGKSIQFIDYCSHETLNDISYESDSTILKLCMVVGYGDEVVDNRIYATSYIEWARINEILEKIGNREDCILHFYVGGLSDSNIIQCKEYERQYGNFKFYLATEHEELMGKLSSYDFGCDIYTDGQELLDDSPMGKDYYGSSYRNSIRNSYFDFLNAGLSIITTNAAKMWDYLSEYNIVVKMNLSNLDIEYLKQNKQYYKKMAREARKQLDVDAHIIKLIQFFEEI